MAKYITPAITPLIREGEIDEKGAMALYEHLISGGVDGILIFGSIGEFFSFPMEKKLSLVSVAVKQAAGRVPIITGTAEMVFDNVLEFSRLALQEGADAVMAIPPYYFPLQPEQIEAYYDALAEQIPGKLYIYNFPDRTGYTIPADVVRRLAMRHENIVGIKDTISGLDHTREVIKAVKPVRPDFEIFSGFDENFVHNVLAGGDGCIGGISNIAPELCHSWAAAVNEGNWEEVTRIQQEIDRLMDIYAVGAPFIPFIKKAVALRGVPVKSTAMFPFPDVSMEQTSRIREILAASKLL